jgi:hypothetical protein
VNRRHFRGAAFGFVGAPYLYDDYYYGSSYYADDCYYERRRVRAKRGGWRIVRVYVCD